MCVAPKRGWETFERWSLMLAGGEVRVKLSAQMRGEKNPHTTESITDEN